MLKVIIRESHLDTNATTNQLRTKLSSLDTYMLTIDSDIGKFNQYVKHLIQSLGARNQTTSDLLINLFKGYRAVNNEAFRTWLQRKSDDSDDGTLVLTTDGLMLAAKNKYDAMIETNTWNEPTSNEKIVALAATVKAVEKKVKFELTKKGSTSNKSGGGKAKSPNKTGDGDHPKNWPPPKSGDKKEKMYRKYMFYWCGKDTGGHCEQWRAHKGNSCRGDAKSPSNPKKKRESTDDPKKKKSDGNTAKKLKIAKAYVSKLEKANTADTSDDDSE